MRHWSDCATHNEPAMRSLPCDCGALELADDAGHGAITGTVSRSGSLGARVADVGGGCLVEAHELPTNGLAADASATDLENTYDGVVVLRVADGVDLNASVEPVVLKLQYLA